MTWQLRTLIALAEDLYLIPRINMVAHKIDNSSSMKMEAF